MMTIAPSLALKKALGRVTLCHQILFNLVGDVFTRMLIKAAKKGYITGFMSSLYPEGVLSL
jgi:hypothetical protein